MKKKTKILKTDRLILRKFKISDGYDVFNHYASHEIVTKYLTWKPHKSLDDTIDYLNDVVLKRYESDYSYCWAITLKATGQVVGCIDVRSLDLSTKKCTLGWVLGDEFWGRGIMTEAAKVVVDYLFEEGFVRIQSHHHIENIASGRVMQKIGMKYEGTLKKYVLDKYGELQDCKIYAVTQK